MGTSIAQDVHALQNFKLPSRIDLRSLKLPLHIDLRSLNCHYVFKKKNWMDGPKTVIVLLGRLQCSNAAIYSEKQAFAAT